MNKKELRQLQPHIFDHFEQILENHHLYHAYLFSGAFASFEMALFLAQSLFCTEKKGTLPCQACRNCRLIEQEQFADLHIVRPQGNVIKTEKIREWTRAFSQSGLEGKQNVFILLESEKLHPHAANALLKYLEEPPCETYIFLLTTKEEEILATIKSRTQMVHFPKQMPQLIQQLEQQGLLKQTAQLIAHISTSYQEALSLANNTPFKEIERNSRLFVKHILTDRPLAYLQAAKLASLADEKEKQERVFRIIEYLLSKHLQEQAYQHILEQLVQAEKMWQANTPFQHVIEYMVLTQQF